MYMYNMYMYMYMYMYIHVQLHISSIFSTIVTLKLFFDIYVFCMLSSVGACCCVVVVVCSVCGFESPL